MLVFQEHFSRKKRIKDGTLTQESIRRLLNYSHTWISICIMMEGEGEGAILFKNLFP